jgi:hypothetical protein
MGSLGTFAAPVTSGRFGKHRRSLRGARTGKMRTLQPLELIIQMTAFR